MGDHSQARPQGYIVRIETKQGCVYRPKTPTELPTPGGQQRRYRFPVAPHMVVQTVSSSVQSFPQGKNKTRLGGSAAGPAHPRIGDDSIELGIDLARSDVPLPGENRSVAPLYTSEAEQDAELYRRGILYHDGTAGEAGTPPAVTVTAANTSTGPAAYQADSLDGIRHTQPAYTVRLVDGKKRRGRKAAAAAVEAEAEFDIITDVDTDVGAGSAQLTESSDKNGDEEAKLIKELPIPEGLRLFTLGNLWEEENPDAAAHSDATNRLLGHEDISLDDIENVEYVLIDDDDLHSMAASWVELDSVAESDDWT
ncbi:hypothetical protein CMQ_275 [Grosmannia clavigera kw1407]|uniref:Uncharacterized protein n=1 Tax=Grosmannia clavigera (strain kw1407 / UAMH 11150) TaxID=655863 RepID=F0XQQ8_GROCL|nr:uncharacterized protein CMQ_275 [Grosmannia clavigera kw1407]EFW99957.1 hypothetical protein CMQ_275 [Grosmannia clavigera kw1407]